MKHSFTWFILLFVSSSYAQINTYSLSYDQDQFVLFSTGTELFTNEAWLQSDSTAVDLPFSFPVWDTAVSTFYYETTGRLILSHDHKLFIDIFTQDGLLDLEGFGQGEQSEILTRSISENGIEGFEIQVLNALYSNFQDTVSFQIRLFESGLVEYVQGPHTNPVIGQGGAVFPLTYTGVYQLITLTPFDYVNGISFYGDFSAPSDSTYTGQVFTFNDLGWNTMLPEGAKLSLVPTTPPISTTVIPRKENTVKVWAHKQRIYSSTSTDVSVYSVDGKKLYEGVIDNQGKVLNYSGIIFVQDQTHKTTRLWISE